MGALGFEPRSAGLSLTGSSLQLIIIKSVDPLENHFHNWSPLGYLITPCPHYFLLALLCLINLLILFFLHFQRICPLFFHTLELLFILTPGVKGKLVNVYNFFHLKGHGYKSFLHMVNDYFTYVFYFNTHFS